jgi:hypothetical protein
MSALPILSPTDAKEDGQCVLEDGQRLAAERGSCTVEDLTRLGWRLDRAQAARTRIIAACDALDADLVRARETAEAIRADHAAAPEGDLEFIDTGEVVKLAPPVREPILTDEDIAFGCERAA